MSITCTFFWLGGPQSCFSISFSKQNASHWLEGYTCCYNTSTSKIRLHSDLVACIMYFVNSFVVIIKSQPFWLSLKFRVQRFHSVFFNFASVAQAIRLKEIIECPHEDFIVKMIKFWYSVFIYGHEECKSFQFSNSSLSITIRQQSPIPNQLNVLKIDFLFKWSNSNVWCRSSLKLTMLTRVQKKL